MKKAIVSVSNDLVTDNRVKRTCLLLTELGYQVVLVGRLRKNSLPIDKRIYETRRLKLFFNKGSLFYAELNIRLFLFLLFKKADIFYSNDLDTLPANFFCSKFKSKTKLIYDTHELFTEVPELENRKFAKNVWLSIENYIFPKLEHVITVNQSIANIYQKKYNKAILVARNTPEKFLFKTKVSKFDLGLPEDKFLIIIQGSGLNVDRGIEEAIMAMNLINQAMLVIVGNGDVIPTAHKLVEREKLSDKVKFFGKRPYEELMQFTLNADIGLALDKPLSENYKFSLPNKLFDYIQAGIPVISSELIELKKIIDKYQLGCFVASVTPEEIAKKINFLIQNPEILHTYRSNCAQAAEIEIWENEKVVLKKLIENLEINSSLN
jgi:glycosyltransferase involved in cell wall biosynthesis